MAWSGYLLEDLLTGCGLEFGRAEIAQGAMQAGAVEPADVLDDGAPGAGAPNVPRLLMDGSDVLSQLSVLVLARRQLPGQVLVKGGTGDLQQLARPLDVAPARPSPPR
jgi:hypothetical protein